MARCNSVNTETSLSEKGIAPQTLAVNKSRDDATTDRGPDPLEYYRGDSG